MQISDIVFNNEQLFKLKKEHLKTAVTVENVFCFIV